MLPCVPEGRHEETCLRHRDGLVRHGRRQDAWSGADLGGPDDHHGVLLPVLGHSGVRLVRCVVLPGVSDGLVVAQCQGDGVRRAPRRPAGDPSDGQFLLGVVIDIRVLVVARRVLPLLDVGGHVGVVEGKPDWSSDHSYVPCLGTSQLEVGPGEVDGRVDPSRDVGRGLERHSEVRVTVTVGIVPGIVAVDPDDHCLPVGGQLARERGYSRYRQCVLAPRQMDVFCVRNDDVIA